MRRMPCGDPFVRAQCAEACIGEERRMSEDALTPRWGVRYYTRTGEPTNLAGFVAEYEKDWTVARTALFAGRISVSTVFLSLDHNLVPSKRPSIFETMVFVRDDEDSALQALDNVCWRYSTEAEALAGHTRAVEYVKRQFWQVAA